MITSEFICTRVNDPIATTSSYSLSLFLFVYTRPRFLILASDGLWDTFSNEEACSFVQDHLKEADFGAKSLAMESYKRGSVDNITVLIIAFKNDVYRIASSTGKAGDAASQPAKSPTASAATASAAVQRSNSIKTK